MLDILNLGNRYSQMKVKLEEFGQSRYELRIQENVSDIKDDVVKR